MKDMLKNSQIFCTLIIIVFCSNACTFDNSNTNIPTSLTPRAKNCEDNDVKNLAIKIFKENNEDYKNIDKSSISSLTLLYPAASNYDKNIDKYSCTGTIVMTSSSGFLPTTYTSDNSYYNKIKNYTKNIKTYDILKTNVEYDSQISEGDILVQLSMYDNNFSCSNICKTITDISYAQKEIQEKREEHIKQEEKQRDEHVNLPNF